jgi:hypothetical protein
LKYRWDEKTEQIIAIRRRDKPAVKDRLVMVSILVWIVVAGLLIQYLSGG